MAQNNLINWITENPFYVLHVSCSDPRRKLSAAADEMSFLLSEDVSSDALGTLLNPSKRLSAEMDWFVDSEDAAIDAIRAALEQGTELPDNGLHPISRLNVALYNFALSDQLDSLEIGFEITEIDRQFSDLSTAYVAEAVNQCRTAAQMTAITELDAEHALQEKRERIRRLIQSKLEMLDQDDYVELITIIAEKYIVDANYDDGVVLTDVLDQYELCTQSEMDALAKTITDAIEAIKTEEIAEPTVKKGIEALIKEVQLWDQYAQPLQLRSQACGVPHKASEDLAFELRGLALFLNNDLNFPALALQLVNALRNVFAELGELSELFEKDSEQLDKLTSDKKLSDTLTEIEKESEELGEESRIIYNLGEKIRSSTGEVTGHRSIRFNVFEKFLKQVLEFNKEVADSDETDELRTALRTRICHLAREPFIKVYNKGYIDPIFGDQRQQCAIEYFEALLDAFGDIPELKLLLENDLQTLRRASSNYDIYGYSRNAPAGPKSTSNGTKNVASNRATPTADSGSADVKKTKVPVIIIAVLLIGAVIWGVVSNSTGAGTTPSVMTGGQSSNQQVIDEDKETSFTNSSELYSDVYADISYIFPAYGVYTEGASSYNHFVCECHTTAGATIWLEISVSDYRLYFDSDASSAIVDREADEIELPTTRIHGWVSSADSVVSGLSDEIHTSKVISFDSCD